MTQPFLPPLSTTNDMTPINGVQSVTPGSALPLGTCRGFIVGVSGNMNITDAMGNNSIIPVVAGVQYWIRLTAVSATSTTATGIFALY